MYDPGRQISSMSLRFQAQKPSFTDPAGATLRPQRLVYSLAFELHIQS
jgi:hypothetical protein